MRRALLMMLLALGVTAPAASAKPADLPDFKNAKIVPGKSIGGAVLGMPRSEAVQAWGGAEGAASCESMFSCIWTGNPNDVQNGPDGRGSLDFDDGVPEFTLGFISIDAADKRKKTAKKLRALQTSKKIGLGDTVKALKKAYGKKVKKSGSGQYLTYTITAGNGNKTRFLIAGKKIRNINIGIR